MSETKLSRDAYLRRNEGDFPETFSTGERAYVKVDDLRYGTNPHQPAAFYKPVDVPCAIGDMEILKTGKSGLSQTNLEDVSYSLNIVKYFDDPACAVMKHVNPSGFAVRFADESLQAVYEKARDADARAAFGSVVAFNVPVDPATAEAIMSSFVECVVAPGFEDGALEVFNDADRFKLNKTIRIIRCGDLSTLPRHVGDPIDERHYTVKVLADGSLVVAAPLLTALKSMDDLKPAVGENKRAGRHESTVSASDDSLRDLLTAWWVNISVRSNGVVIVKNGQTLAVGTGEQDRVGAVEQAIEKVRSKYEGEGTIVGAAMASDGFFPFPDGVEVAAEAGVNAIIAPAGSLRDADVVKRANELGVALFHAPERVFSHH